ncbi:organic solute transporter subunit alpha-like isoform X2 [Panulirus ornatus]|uniref:organic solute transporter subunit alpha-like isoform X2 n=1 Tax=Panulirus ornatus TaxID=150431 RepID=UPI003A8BE190
MERYMIIVAMIAVRDFISNALGGSAHNITMGTNAIIASVIKCNNSYVPTTTEYLNVLGPYGTLLLSIGGLITVILYLLFFDQVYFTTVHAHPVYRRHISWIASVYPFMTLMSVVSVAVPRAHNICTAAKVTYMSVGISHFTDLTVLMFGSEEVMIAKTEGERLKLNVGPLCCCCSCLPSPPVGRFPLRVVMFLSSQLPFTQAAYYLAVLILLSADNITIGNVNPSGLYLWLNLFNFASFTSGVYSLQILTRFSKGHLESYGYRKKSISMRTLVLVTNLQSLIFNIMANYNAFPCIPPYIPPQVYKQTVENLVYILEMMVLGTFTFWQYRNDQFQHANPVEACSSPQHHPIANSASTSCNSSHTSVRSTLNTAEGIKIPTINANDNTYPTSDLNGIVPSLITIPISDSTSSPAVANHLSLRSSGSRKQREPSDSGDASRTIIRQPGARQSEN